MQQFTEIHEVVADGSSVRVLDTRFAVQHIVAVRVRNVAGRGLLEIFTPAGHFEFIFEHSGDAGGAAARISNRFRSTGT